MDSELKQWTYDDQRRVAQQTYAFGNVLDTTRYTYLNDRYIESMNQYINGSLGSISNTVYYHHMDRTDSILTSTTGYGIETGNNPGYATYFYYNQENQDSLEMHFNNFGVPSLQDSSRYFYTGMNLDSVIIWPYQPSSGIIAIDVYYFSGGNLNSQSYYENDELKGLPNYHIPIFPQGGLYIADPTPFAPFPTG